MLLHTYYFKSWNGTINLIWEKGRGKKMGSGPVILLSCWTHAGLGPKFEARVGLYQGGFYRNVICMEGDTNNQRNWEKVTFFKNISQNLTDPKLLNSCVSISTDTDELNNL